MDDSHIPIDINTSKLMEWLISRHHVKKDWHTNIIKIREKINLAIQDMPEHEGIIKLLSGQHINYFHCIKIVNILKETEADTKNLFGRYGSKRMKDWQDITYNYEKNNVYLAELSQILMRNCTYEIPAVKKEIVKFEQVQSDNEKKIKEYTNSKSHAQQEFNSTCKEFGVAGVNLKQELLALLDDIPNVYSKSVKNFAAVKPVIEFYEAFTECYNTRKGGNSLSMLKYLIENGNTTAYEYTYGEKPLKIEVPKLKASYEEEPTNPSEIDFADDVQIDFGDDGDNKVEGEIDWGAPAPEEGFELVENADVNTNLDESGIVVEKSGAEGGIATGNDAYTILDNPQTREKVISDLLELQSFLKMRIFELSSKCEDFFFMAQNDLPTIVQMQTVESVTSLSGIVQTCINILTNKHIMHLHNMKHSEKYIDILCNNLKLKLTLVERMIGNISKTEEKISAIKLEAQKLSPLLKNLIAQTKILQRQIEEDISKKYNGRVCHIVGAINML